MKNKLRNLIALFLFIFNATSWAETLEINELRLKNLSVSAGQKMSLFYVNGREPSIGSVGHRLQVLNIVGAPVVAVVDAAHSVSFPAARIPRRAGFVNYLLFVVHGSGQQEVSVRNPDGQWVPDARNIATPVEGQQYGDMSLIKLFNLRSNSNTLLEINASDVFGEY